MAAGSQNRQLLHESLPVNLAMVASPSALMPSRTNTFFTVRNRILISNHRERLSTYHTSSLNFSSQLSELRPFTCAHPVTPGRTSWRRDRKSTRLNTSHVRTSYAVFCLKK